VTENMPKCLLAIVGEVIGFSFGNRGLNIEKKKKAIEEITIARMNRLREIHDRGEMTPNVFIGEMESIRKGYESLTRMPAPSSGGKAEEKSPRRNSHRRARRFRETFLYEQTMLCFAFDVPLPLFRLELLDRVPQHGARHTFIVLL
jgi:hypothetical protein